MKRSDIVIAIVEITDHISRAEMRLMEDISDQSRIALREHLQDLNRRLVTLREDLLAADRLWILQKEEEIARLETEADGTVDPHQHSTLMDIISEYRKRVDHRKQQTYAHT